jgi:hypothetical protein
MLLTRQSPSRSDDEENTSGCPGQTIGPQRRLGARRALIVTPDDRPVNVEQSLEMAASWTLHLACAEEHGFQEIFTNDRHMLQATGGINRGH